jgi:tRNA dimethylallyltransferase
MAFDIAKMADGTVINADSMQVYNDLHVLTARPSAAEVAALRHRLYGVLGGRDDCSAGLWAAMAAAEIADARAWGHLPVVVGGTGLYIRALVDGLSPIPPIPDAIRKAARALLAEEGNEAFHRRLAAADPETASRLAVGNSQRLARAWEVLQATGRSISAWQREPPVRPIAGRVLVICLDPPRADLNAAIDRRFDGMVENGALDEVRSLLTEGLPASAPVMKALGVPELAAALRGETPLEEAVARAKLATRQFAKRQGTWFRRQLRADHVINAQYSESLRAEIFKIVRQFLLTAPP